MELAVDGDCVVGGHGDVGGVMGSETMDAPGLGISSIGLLLVASFHSKAVIEQVQCFLGSVSCCSR